VHSPDFVALNQIEEDVLNARLEAIRKSISHAGEKGRALEAQVRRVLRDMLPSEYGLTTGFIVWNSPSGPALSSQLDIIIYDAIRHSPLIHLESCDVLPLEAVYGYVEVKATIRSSSDEAVEPSDDSIELCIQKNAAIRNMRARTYRETLVGSPVTVQIRQEEWLAIRSYVVAFEAVGSVASDMDSLACRVSEVLAREKHAHIHGLFIPNHGFLYTRPVDVNTAVEDDYFHVVYTAEHALLAFKSVLLAGLATFNRPPESWSPVLETYFGSTSQWHERTPKKK
jgi:Domain of unknown function (DUF6602)